MLDITNTSLGVVIFLLRLAVVLLLYFFLWQVVRIILRDLRGAGQQAATNSLQSPYGQMIVERSGQSGVPVGKSFQLGPSNLIGRSMENCEIALNDTFLSLQHARLELRGDQWVLEDLNSTNGTFVNEVEVRAPTVLEPGDIVRVGRVELRLAG
jgi:pSer/pThr/pTyr-binding forkhead associated (FHA) protein